jgi:hypothetical protein
MKIELQGLNVDAADFNVQGMEDPLILSREEIMEAEDLFTRVLGAMRHLDKSIILSDSP